MTRIRHRGRRIPDSIVLPSRWPRRIVWAGVALVLAAAVLWDRSAHGPVQGNDHTRYHDQSFPVARVIDGDTLDIAVADRDKPVTRIRLLGVDAPETAHGGGSDMHYAREAAAFVEQTLGGKWVHVVLPAERTRGKYGRLLAYVYLERAGPMFNELLLEEGYAYADFRFDHHYYNQFKAIEERARRAAKGLWAEVSEERMPEWRRRYESHLEDHDP